MIGIDNIEIPERHKEFFRKLEELCKEYNACVFGELGYGVVTNIDDINYLGDFDENLTEIIRKW